MAFGHGMQDAAKTAGVVALTLVASGYRPPGDLAIPWWVIALSAVVLSLGTYAGGWRIMRTLGRRIIDVDPPQGFAAETVSAAVLYAATATGAPDLDDARHHLGDHGRRRDPVAQGRAVGGGPLDRQRRGCSPSRAPASPPPPPSPS